MYSYFYLEDITQLENKRKGTKENLEREMYKEKVWPLWLPFFRSHLLKLRGQESILIICTSNVQINVCPLFSFSCLLQNNVWECFLINQMEQYKVRHTVCVAGQSCIFSCIKNSYSEKMLGLDGMNMSKWNLANIHY